MRPRLAFERRTVAVPVAAAGQHLEAAIGSLRAIVRWDEPARVLAGVGFSVPVAVRTSSGTRRVRFGMARPFTWVAALWLGRLEATEPKDPENEEDAMESDNRPASMPEIRAIDEISRALAHAADGAGAVGPTTTVGERAIVPLTETIFSGGFGTGAGGSRADTGAGGGGGGFGRSRTVAIAVVGPDGVSIQPVVDRTALGLAAVAAAAGLFGRMLFGRR